MMNAVAENNVFVVFASDVKTIRFRGSTATLLSTVIVLFFSILHIPDDVKVHRKTLPSSVGVQFRLSN